MASTRFLNFAEPSPELKRWLWYGLAYLAVIVGLAVLARYVQPLAPSGLSWFD